MQDEKQILEQMEQDIEQEITATTKDIEREKQQIDQYKEYVKSSASDMDQEEFLATREDVNKNIMLSTQSKKNLDVLKRQAGSPYFGKITFQFADDGEIMPLYIGTNGFWSREDNEQKIFDWRAPVSSLYYEYENRGEASYEAPMGTIKGNILDKLQIRVKDGQLQYAVSTNKKVDDDILLQELSQNASTKMKSVVATIQKEQDEIIRDDKTHTLIVDGCAGSGKTVIAMHRLAWLLYNHGNTMHSGNILLFSPNHIFSDYISDILPELGEENVPEVEWDDFMQDNLFVQGDYETHQEQAEYIIKGKHSDVRWKNIQRKSSIAFFHAFLDYVEDFCNYGITLGDYQYDTIKLTGEQMKTLFTGYGSDVPVYQRFARMGAKIESMAEDEANRSFSDSRKAKRAADIQRQLIEQFAQPNIVLIYQDFLNLMAENNPGIEEYLNQEGKICFEDMQAIFYLQILLCGGKNYSDITHVMLDEMQDYTVFQFAIIEKLFTCSKTILGDPYQVLFYREKETILDVLKTIFPEAKTKTLTQSYRSTEEISRFCNEIIGRPEDASFARHGREPVIYTAKSRQELMEQIKQTVASIDTKKYENIAVLCDGEEDAYGVYQELQDTCKLSYISESHVLYQGGMAVMPKFLAKGMEFDVVLVVSFDQEPESVVERNAFYISCTRALHELHVFHMGKYGDLI